MSAADAHLTVQAATPEATQALAARLSGLCESGDCLTLSGELGAGKTCFARGFIQALLEHAEDIVSPTFTLVQNYQTQQGTSLWHFDLYRLTQAGELEEIGLQDALEQGITLIEWPALAQAWLPESALHITLCESADNARAITMRGPATHWQERLRALEEDYAAGA